MKYTRIIALAVLVAIAPFAWSEKRPNIVLILADDLGYGDLGCYGSRSISTPYIDSLAREGMKFESFYVHNRCSPSRAALMTGCVARRVGLPTVVYHRSKLGLHPDEFTLPKILRKQGYKTGIVVKWHLEEWPQFNPVHHGFDEFFGLFSESEKKKALFLNTKKVTEVERKKDRYSTKSFVSAGLDFISDHKEQPFFLFYASQIPHVKWMPHGDFEGASKQGAFGDCVQQLDWEVGKILAKIDELGLKENTLVIFASDNGAQLSASGHGSNAPLRGGKWTQFEGGIRVPCVMRWPGKIPAKKVNDELVAIYDLFPTLCIIYRREGSS